MFITNISSIFYHKNKIRQAKTGSLRTTARNRTKPQNTFLLVTPFTKHETNTSSFLFNSLKKMKSETGGA